jgi:hypothetical protein
MRHLPLALGAAALAATLGLAASSAAQQPPPAPAPAPTASAWACTRDTLLQGLPCTIEGRTAAQTASREQAQENQRQAHVLAEGLCGSFARMDTVDPEAALQRVCLARVDAAVRRCGGDGSRRLLDDNGRFNPGHARCYGALASMMSEMSDLEQLSSSCCACVADRCNANEGQCTERLAQGRDPDVASACLTGVCASECAALQLSRGAVAPSSKSAPARPAAPPSRNP